MTDTPKPEVLEVLRLAIVAAGEAKDVSSWRGNLAVLIPEIAATMHPGSREYQQVEGMFDAVVLAGEFLGIEFNDRSRRLKVIIQADVSRKGEPEHVWTERTDTKLGAAQATIVRNLTKGCRVIVWKGVELATHEDKDGNPVKVRMLRHIMRTDAEVRDAGSPTSSPAPSETASPPRRSEGAPPAQPAPNAAEPDPPESGGSGGSQVAAPSVPAALERLNGAQRLSVAKWAAGEGISNLYDPNLPTDQANAVTAYIELLLKGMTG
jgi:hypothetical protein